LKEIKHGQITGISSTGFYNTAVRHSHGSHRALYVMAAVKAFQFIKKKLGKSEDEDAREYNQRRQNLYIYIPKRGYIRDLNHDCSELLYTDKEHEAKVFMYIDGIRGVLSYMKLVKNAGVTLPDYYIVTNGVKEEVAKIHF
jgi:hypothetical protein